MMAVTCDHYGMTAAGTHVERYLLVDGDIRVGILTFGGVIDEISVPDRSGVNENVVLALPNLGAYEATPNFSSLVGRYANRISHGGFWLDGVFHRLALKPTEIVSHGGSPNFSQKVWAASPWPAARGVGVTLRYVSADGENGFPGELTVAVSFSLHTGRELRIEYEATTTKPTVINLTHHVYFNLAGGQTGSIDGQQIQILADRYARIDSDQNANGEISEVAGAMDLRELTRIGNAISQNDPQLALANGFNHNYILDRPSDETLSLAARGYDPASGRMLEVRTTEPGIQFYTANEFSGQLVGTGDRRLRQGAGYALETQHFPDSPNQPHFPSTTLRPDAVFRSTTSFRFGVQAD